MCAELTCLATRERWTKLRGWKKLENYVRGRKATCARRIAYLPLLALIYICPINGSDSYRA